MITGLILIEGRNVTTESLRSTSLGNAKQLVVGRTPEDGVVLHIAAESPTDFGNALMDFSQISGVTGVLTLALRSSP